MNLTKAETMKAVIDGSDIQYMSVDGKWSDLICFHKMYLIEKLNSIETSYNDVDFRIKPVMKTISYRNCLYKVRGEFFVSMWSSYDIISEKDTQNLKEFVKWLGDKVTIEVGEL